MISAGVRVVGSWDSLVGTKGPTGPTNNGTCNLICNQKALAVVAGWMKFLLVLGLLLVGAGLLIEQTVGELLRVKPKLTAPHGAIIVGHPRRTPGHRSC
jgi:hypothetical protein